MEEFTNAQIERMDAVENAAYEFGKLLTEQELPWNFAWIGELADAAAEIMVRHGYPVHYPSRVDGEIQEWWRFTV